MNWNGEKKKKVEKKICVRWEYEWNSGRFSGENVNLFSELLGGENIMNRRKGSRTLRYGDCVLRGNCVRGLDKGWERSGGSL